MYTSRSEHRLILRPDNADLRLAETGYAIGLLDKNLVAGVREKKKHINELIGILKKTKIQSGEKSNKLLTSLESSPVENAVTAYQLLKRPEIKIFDIMKNFISGNSYDEGTLRQVEICVKYEGYIERETQSAQKLENLENFYIKQDIDYYKISGITIESKDKLSRIRPETLGQASRIAGISPSDIFILMVQLKK